MKWVLLTTILAIYAAQTPPDIHLDGIESRVHARVNEERRALGLPSLTRNTQLSDVARTYSRDMARRGFFSHVNPERQDPQQRLNAKSVVCKRFLSENLYMTSLYSRVTITGGNKTYDWKTPDMLGKEIVEGWMTSPGHRQNILTTGYTGTGLGVALSADNTLYVTQLFCG